MVYARRLSTIRGFVLCLLAAGSAAAAQTVLQVSNPQFPLTPVGQSVTKSVTLTVPNGGNSVVFTLIQLVAPSGDYTMGAITGCVVDGTTANTDGTTCTVPVTFTPSLPGSLNSPLPISRTATLQVYDSENGNIQNFGVGLLGGGTTPRAIVVPGIISDLVGNDVTPTSGFAGDGGPASGAVFNNPSNMAVDGAGNIYISDTANCVVRRIDKVSGTVSTFAGMAPSPTPQCGQGYDGAGALGTLLNGNTGIAVDFAGNVYIADTGNGAVREVNPFTGTITTIAGQLNLPGYNGSGGAANATQMHSPTGIAVDGFGDIFIADSGNFVVREVSPVTGNMQTIAGVATQQGAPATETYGVPATSFLLGNPQQVTVDSAGNVYIGDATTSGVIEVYAATQNTNLLFAVTGIPTSLAVDAADTLHTTLTGQCGVYKLPAGTFQQITIAGNGSCTASGDGGSALAAGLNNPTGVVVDGAGSFYILENDGVRFVDSTGATAVPVAFGQQQVLAVAGPQSVLLFNGDVPTPPGMMPNTLSVYLSQVVSSPFATVAPGTGITDCSAATATVPVPLNPAAYCSLSFTFTPQLDSPYTAATNLFELEAATGAQITQAIQLSGTGTGVPATASLLPSMGTLTAGILGGVAMQQFTLTNTSGGAPLAVTSIGFSNAAVGGFSQTNNCTAPLAANQYCTIIVRYAPTLVGSVSQTLNVVDNGLGTPQTVALTGIGVAPTASLSPSSLNFVGIVKEAQPEQAFTLTNTSSTASLAVGAVYFASTNGFYPDTPNSTCTSAVLPPGTSCTILVSFSPYTLTSQTNTLTVLDNTTAGMETATVNGTSIAPVADLSASALNFASSTLLGGQSAPQSVQLQNTGTATLHISGIALVGNSPNTFQLTNGCAATLAPGASCTLQVVFAPLSPGAVTAQIAITDDSGGQLATQYVTQSVLLYGAVPVVTQQSSFSLANAAFPSTPVGNATTQNVTLTINTGSTVLKSIAIAPGFTEFTINSITGCAVDGITPNPGGTVCTLVIQFSPTSIGSQHNAQVLVTTLEGSSAVPYLLGLSGLSTGQLVALTPGLIYSYAGYPGSGLGEYGVPENPLSGLGGPATNAYLGSFQGIVQDAAKNMYIADSYYGLIYRVTPDGIINLFAGVPPAPNSGPASYGGDGGAALQANIAPQFLALDGNGNLYLSQFEANLRVINGATNVITSVLTNGTPCSAATDAYGDGCPAGQVAYSGDNGMAFGPDGNLYYSTAYGIHKYNPQTQLVTLFAGSAGAMDGGPDDGPALGAAMTPTALTFDSAGNMLYIDSNLYVRKIAPDGSKISLLAGTPGSVLHLPFADNEIGGYVPSCTTEFGENNALYHSSGNGGPAALAVFCDLAGIAVDPANNIYLSDVSASEIRRIDSATGTIVEVTGENSSVDVDYGDQNVFDHDYAAYDVSLDRPEALLVDGYANIYVAGLGGHVRKIDVSKSSSFFEPYYETGEYSIYPTGIGGLYGPQQVTAINAGNAGPVTFTAPFTTPTLFGISTPDFTRDTATADCISTNAMLMPGMECPINTDFTPTVAGSPLIDTQTITDTAGTQTIALVGYSAGGSSVTLTPALLSFAGAVNATTAPQIFTLTNSTPTTFGIASISLIGVNPGAFATSSNCGASIAANTTCQISVTFTAPALGNFLAQLSMVYTTTVNGTVVPTTLLGGLIGLGGTPEGQFYTSATSSNPANFGNQNIGIASSMHSLSFTSTGDIPLLISGFSLAGTDANQFEIVSNNCPASLAPNNACTIGVTFTPAANGTLTASLSAADNAPDTPQQITLTGVGVGATPAVLAVVEAVHVADASLPQTAVVLPILEAVHVTDASMPQTGASLAVVEAVHITDTPAISSGGHSQVITFTQPLSPVADRTGPYNLVAVSSSALPVTFSVLSGPGSISGAQLTITGPGVITIAADQAGNSGFLPAPEVQATVTVSAVPFITPVPAGGTLPAGTTSSPFPVTITFTGSLTLGSLNTATLGAPGNDFAIVSGGSCAIGSAYGAGQSCTVMLTFTPTGPGVIIGQLNALDNQGNLAATTLAASVRYR